MTTNDVKTFSDLIREVQDRGICGKCGGCVSFCSAGELNALTIDAAGAPVYANEDRCLKCGICYLICPQVDVLDNELRGRLGWTGPIGPARKLTSAYAADESIRNAGTDGGVVTALLVHALEKHVIQAAVVSRQTGAFDRGIVVATTPEEIIAAAGSHFDESRQLHEAGQRYTTFAPTVREIRDLRRRDIRRIALVGTPCQIHTIRKMQLLNVLPADTVALTIGLFCMESFSFDEAARQRLESVLGVNLDQIDRLNVKDDVIILTGKAKTVHVPFYLVDEFARPACFACSDFSNEFADISCGGLGSPDDHTTVVVRSAVGERVYNGARQAETIIELAFDTPESRRNHVTEMMAKIVSFSSRKRQRARERLGA
ncbi:Coenzyme F420 hydrogenase/dehydrogenase, beta subunit C-terminal domain [Candidatus Bipolaricaulota bacterium]|nr:Coenzyme F420 hydrogenase/dehydrogenase, beta subunit C-terminal domain [Candidatus Bipolaricaulota bacterium]